MQAPPKILVVDENDDSRRAVVFALERAGFAVSASATGAHALQLAGATAPDVVVLDADLPDAGGFEVCERLTAEPSTRPIPVLLLSGTSTGLAARMQGSRAAAFLAKPCEPAELVSAVNGLVRLREAEAAKEHYRLLFERKLDVSDLERAEEALRQRETQLRNLGDNLPGGVIYQVVRRLDGSNYFPYMSSGLERTFGVSASQAMADAGVVYRLVLPEDLARIRDAGDESIRTGNPMDVEYRMRTPDGEIRWMNLRARPSRLADGATQWDVIALDVTDRKHADEALREREAQLHGLADGLQRSEARYRLLFERSFVGMFRTRSDGTLMECNHAFARILGYGSAADVHGCSILGHYATPAEREPVVAKLAAGEDVIEAEVTARRRDGSLVPVVMSVRRIADQDGPVHEGILLDLTDRKRAEEATALRSAAELANAAAHEINNPLTVISGQLELMRSGRSIAERIQRVQAAVGRIRDIVSHMTRITRLERSDAWPGELPRMLDIRRSGATDREDAEPS